jgi:hypothetical protein
MTQFSIYLWKRPVTDVLHVGVMGCGFYKFDSYAAAGYVEEKLGVSCGDAPNLADFINSQVLSTWEEWEPQGRYDRSLTDPIKIGSLVTASLWGNLAVMEVQEFQISHQGMKVRIKSLNSDVKDLFTADLYDLTLVAPPAADATHPA